MLFFQVFLQQSDVLGIASEHGIYEVADEWYKANQKVDRHINPHLRDNACWQSSFDSLAALYKTRGEVDVNGISDTGFLLAYSSDQ